MIMTEEDNEETIKLQTYLDAFLEPTNNTNHENNHEHQNSSTHHHYPRQKCCGTSRSLYCTECSKLLIQKDQWPASVRNGILDLPFQLDVILSDRRLSATGFHALVLLRASLDNGDHGADHDADVDHADGVPVQEPLDDPDPDPVEHIHTPNHKTFERVRLYDTKIGDTLPTYNQTEQDDQTYVLFPSPNSIPLSAVSKSIQRLIVLDCKWTKTGTQQNIPQICHLPMVHLDHPPMDSFFWRWHNAGSGMCSTLEAIYYAALEVSKVKEPRDWNVSDSSSSSGNGVDVDIDAKEKRDALIDLMWLFGIQRAATAKGARREGKPAPFSKGGKHVQRDLRRTEKGSEKHLRDIELGRRLKEEAKAKNISGS